jgi:hypothetical protein
MMMKKNYTEEILCDPSRQVVPYAGAAAGHTDNVHMLSEEMAGTVYWKALQYRIEVEVQGKSVHDADEVNDFLGQCGLLRGEQLVPSPGFQGSGGSRYKVIPVTAKHNMHAGLGNILLAKIFCPSLDSCKRAVFPETGLTALPSPLILKNAKTEDEAELPFGLDFTFGTPIVNPGHSFASKKTSFEVVRHDFEIQNGQKIGICVYRSDDKIVNDVEKTEGKLSDAEVLKYYGPAKVPVILTGTVRGVYGDRDEVFSHSINTYEGCSGAVIFLLDKNQPPESVVEGDYGKAIGIHAAGYAPNNLGMSIIKAFHEMTNEELAAVH